MVLDDGRLGLLDFGSCRSFDEHEWDIIKLGVDGYREGGEKLVEAMRFSCELSDEQAADSDRMQFLEDYCLWYWEPMENSEEAFDFTDPAYIQKGMKLFGECSRKRYTQSHPVNLYNARYLYGVRVLAHTMRARVYVGRTFEEEAVRAGL